MRPLRGWKAVSAVALAAVVLTVLAPVEVDAAGAPQASVKAANVVTITHDAADPAAVVVGSSTTYSRVPGQPVLLTISVAPAGRVARFHATLRNVSGTTLLIGSAGVRVDARVTRRGRAGRGTTLWSVRDTRLAALAPGASTTVAGIFPLPPGGSYTVEAAARY